MSMSRGRVIYSMCFSLLIARDAACLRRSARCFKSIGESLRLRTNIARPIGSDSEDKMSKLINLKQVQDVVPLSKSQIYRLMKTGDFPKSVKLGVRRVAWREDEVRQWAQSRPSSVANISSERSEHRGVVANWWQWLTLRIYEAPFAPDGTVSSLESIEVSAFDLIGSHCPRRNLLSRSLLQRP